MSEAKQETPKVKKEIKTKLEVPATQTQAPAAPESREKRPFVKRERREGEQYEGTRQGRPNQKSKKKPCAFCMDKKTIDYKDVNRIKKFVTEKGKILPSRQTGVCARHQRELTVAIKVARNMALLPFKGE